MACDLDSVTFRANPRPELLVWDHAKAWPALFAAKLKEQLPQLLVAEFEMALEFRFNVSSSVAVVWIADDVATPAELFRVVKTLRSRQNCLTVIANRLKSSDISGLLCEIGPAIRVDSLAATRARVRTAQLFFNKYMRSSEPETSKP